VLTAFRFFYKPITLTALGFGLAALAYVAMTQDVLEEGRDKRRVCVPMPYLCVLRTTDTVLR
jgi:phosphatidylserine synthase 2